MTEAQRIIANQYIQIQRMKRLERKEKEFKEKQKKEIKKFRNIAHLNQEILAINTHRKYERNEYYRGKNKLNESISTIINEKELLVKINDANLIISGSIDEQCKTPKEEEKINISSINRATIQKSIKEITSRSKRNTESSLLDSNIQAKIENTLKKAEEIQSSENLKELIHSKKISNSSSVQSEKKSLSESRYDDSIKDSNEEDILIVKEHIVTESNNELNESCFEQFEEIINDIKMNRFCSYYMTLRNYISHKARYIEGINQLIYLTKAYPYITIRNVYNYEQYNKIFKSMIAPFIRISFYDLLRGLSEQIRLKVLLNQLVMIYEEKMLSKRFNQMKKKCNEIEFSKIPFEFLNFPKSENESFNSNCNNSIIDSNMNFKSD